MNEESGKKRILVVDDEPDMLIYVSTVLETAGYLPVAARNGSEALIEARSALPSLLVLDVMMPKIEDGIKTFQEFRTDPHLSNIPVIMLSAISRKTFSHYLRLLPPSPGKTIAEPEGYMEKPPDAGELLEWIGKLLSKK